MIPLRDANPTRRTPVVTLAIVIACFVAFGVELFALASGGEDALIALIEQYGSVPAELTAALKAGQLVSEPVLDVFTSMFLHAGWLHLLGNMLYLWIFGNNVEDRMGRVLFLLFYLAGGIVGGRRADAHRPRLHGADDRGVRRDRGDPRGVPRAVPRRADPVARVPGLLLPADRGARRRSCSGSGSCSR